MKNSHTPSQIGLSTHSLGSRKPLYTAQSLENSNSFPFRYETSTEKRRGRYRKRRVNFTKGGRFRNAWNVVQAAVCKSKSIWSEGRGEWSEEILLPSFQVLIP
jgi:hypothetical protein